MAKDSCDIYCFNEEKVDTIRGEMAAYNTLRISELFKALSDETRLKIAYALTRNELCVCDVANIIDSSVATASHHLRKLKKMNIATFRKEGKMAFYQIDNPVTKGLIESVFVQLREE